MLEQPFCDRTQELLKTGKVIAVYNPSVKIQLWGCAGLCVREKEELKSHEIHAKDWNLNTSKTAEAEILLDLIATLRMKSWNTNQEKVDVNLNNKETWRITNT